MSVEDSTGDADNPLFDFEHAVARIAAARAAIDATGSGIVLTARSEGFIAGRPEMGETPSPAESLFRAPARDCLYAPGLRDGVQIAAVVEAVAPNPVNVLTPGLGAATLADLGARRISVGGSLARAAWGEFLRTAREIADSGSFDRFARAEPGHTLNALFGAPCD